MEDGKSFPSHNMSSDTNVDFDLMDELLSEGCWLETTQGSDFLQPSSSNPTALFNSSYFLPTTTTTTSTTSTISEGLSPNPSQINKQEEREGSIVPRTPAFLQPSTSVETRYLNANNTFRNAETSSQPERGHPSGGSSELDRRWWIEPSPHSTVIDRLGRALNHIRCSTKNAEVLIQIWVPVRKEGKQFLITNGQPFELDSSCQRLESYRNASMEYEFPADEDSSESVGLPGRVFLGKVPEWTPDVRFFSRNEYPRIHHAQRYDVRGTLALPIFELGSRSCLGVVEVVMTTQKINYRPDLENICKALESVNLRGSEVASPSILKAPNFSYQAVLLEILEVLRAVCETHRLPLAQTWVPCVIRGNEGCRHSDQNYTHYVSTVNSACCVSDPKIWGFHEACSEHHLFKGQGVVGRALTTNQPCFFSDITTLSKKDYPLSHYARMFGLGAAVAIRLRSKYTGTTDYVLEFFLPVDCRDTEQQKVMLRSLSLIIQNVCRSLRVVMDKELQEETTLSNNEVAAPSNPEPFRDQMPMLTQPIPSKGSSDEGSSWITQLIEVQRKGKGVQKEEPAEGFKVTTHWDSSDVVLQQGQPLLEFKQHSQDSRPKHNTDSGGDSSLVERKVSTTSRAGGKRRTKMEKTISLQVLRQYFPGSLKDAAKSLGVCPTTLKRICRQHGITRWPSRKIKKVGHSLRKLQVVIDSVRGAEGAFQIGSIYTNFSELTSPNLSGTSAFSRPQPNDQSNTFNVQPEGVSSPQAAASISPPSSSCSQSSSSSLCCSTQQNPVSVNLGGKEDTSISEKAEQLNSIVQEDPGLLARSQSQRYLTDLNPSLSDSLPPIPSSSHVYHDRGAPRLKVTYGEEKVRFSMQLQWGFRDLQQEIAKRFFIDDMSRNVIQYLDDDNEWVLLTCDADLEECMEIYKSYQTQTIKLRVQQASYPNLGSSLGSTAQ